ncbi:hypothetical protein ACOMHN_032975 [Nucella lapillus]
MYLQCFDDDSDDEDPESKQVTVTLHDLEPGRKKRRPGPPRSKYRCKGVYYVPPGKVIPTLGGTGDKAVIHQHMSLGYGHPASLFMDGKTKGMSVPITLTPDQFKAHLRQLYPRLRGPFSVLTLSLSRKPVELLGEQCSPQYLKSMGVHGYQGYLIIRDQMVDGTGQGETVLPYISYEAKVKTEGKWIHQEFQSSGQGEPVLLGVAQTREDMTPEDAEPLPAGNCFPSTGISEEPLSYEGRMKVIASRFTPGQELRQSLLSLVRAYNLKAAFVVTCVGSLTKATLRLADSTTIVTYNGPFEIVSLVGTLSGKAGHLHISLSDNKGLVIGGHVVGDLIIHTTAEVVIGECEGLKFEREKDRETGFHELAVYPGKR